ncbi:MAG: hypothetical protein FJ399_01125, partial [Verrucomicrobia bacterium]|nr:hypothetical protein [Verrucomicrobiota bacterium]
MRHQPTVMPCSSPPFPWVGASRRSHRMLPAVVLLALVAGPGRAQLAWSWFDESSLSPVTGTPGRVTITVPAGQRATLVATNFVPIDFSAATASPVVVALTFTVSGGLGNLAPGTRAIGMGLFNHNNTATNFADDTGYFVWVNGRSTGSLLELRRRNANATSASLLFPTGASFSNLGSGGATQTAGALTDGVPYTISFQLNRSAAGVSMGTGAQVEAAGVWLRGDGLSQTAYTNPDNPPAATRFNELAFMFQNTTAGPVTLTLEGITGVTAQVPPAIVTQPQQLILNPGQTGTLTVTASGTPPLSYEWRRDGIPVGGGSGTTFTVGAAGAYSVIVSNAFGSAVSSAAVVVISATPVPATIETHPVALTVNAGQPATFSVTAFGSAPLNFQWQRNSVAIPGANGSTYTISGATATDAGIYSVVVSNATTSAVSQPATLTVNAPPAITTHPASVLVNLGQQAQLSVVAGGSGTAGALAYQWLRNGAPIAGATASTLSFASVAAGDLGTYTVRVTNATGSVVSNPAVLTAPSTMAITGRLPAAGALAANPDTPLRLTFDREVRAGVSGRVRVHRATDGTVVETLDLGAPGTRLVGTNPVPYNFLPALAEGNTIAFFPRTGTLVYGQTYYVTIEGGAILDATGATFSGFAEPAAWRFATKNAGPIPGTAAVSVAADGSGDFSTVQGAIDYVPAGNTTRVVITVRRGTYRELVYIGATKPFITLRGEDRTQTILAYPNNANFNSGNNRAMVACEAGDFTLETITLRNTTPRGGSQAEAIRGNGQRAILSRVNLSSYQDTLLWNGTLFVTDSLIEGEVDFMWGGGAAYFQRCELRALGAGYYAQVRNSQSGKGHVYVDCRLTAAEGVSNVYLARIDPREGATNTWPFSQVVFLNCTMGAHVVREGWRLENATGAPSVQFWEYQSSEADGATLDVSGRLRDARQIDDTTAARYRDPEFVLGFRPQIAPAIEVAPAAQSVAAGTTLRLTVTAAGAPAPNYQWLRNGAPLGGATDATLVLLDLPPEQSGDYAVRVTNANGSVTSAPATLTVLRGPLAGAYAGTIAGGGAFALYVRDNGTAVFLARGAGFAGTLAVRSAAVDANGRLRITVGAALVEATIDATGSINGSVGPAPGSGIAAPTAQLTGGRSTGSGAALAHAGYHQLRLAGGALTVDVIAGANGQALAVVTDGTLEAGSGSVDGEGRLSVGTTGGRTLTGVLGAGTAGGSATLVTPSAAGN